MKLPFNRRRFYRVLLSPRFQLRFGAYFTLIASSILLVWGTLAVYMLFAIVKFNSQSGKGMPLGEYLVAILRQHQTAFIVALGLSALIFMGMAVYLTERVSGPMRGLLNHIEALKNGHYDHKTVLRKNDELKPLMIALNELSEALSQRHPEQKPLDKTGS